MPPITIFILFPHDTINMLVDLAEMNSVVDAYKLDAMTDNTPEITATCLRAAEARVMSYLASRYDLNALAKMPRNSPYLADLKEIIKDIALYLIMRRHNIDIAYSRVVEAYKLHADYLSRVSSGEIALPSLPLKTNHEGEVATHLLMGSRPKQDFRF